MKTLLLSLTFLALSFVLIPTTPANACATCGCGNKAAHSHAQQKTCEKCLKAGKTCKCGDKMKKPCEKTMGQNNANRVLIEDGYNNKGSLILKSGQSFNSRAAIRYND